MVAAPDIELLWWEGCPSTDHALESIRDALVELGLGDTDVRLVEIRSDEQAQAAGFVGSPTILIDGIDLVKLAGAGGAGEPDSPMLTCRLYRRRDGRISPTPDPQDIRAALARAVADRQSLRGGS
jgi:hypothetical protein